MKLNNVEFKTRQLIREIKRSNVYNQYRRLQMKLTKDTELNKRVNEFRKACFIIQNKPQEPDDIQKLEVLNKEYSEILENSDVREFFTAERGLALMMNQLMDQIYGSLDMDVSFLDD
ncbi:YlbF family regulator [Frisingicoccus sp.]|uniref:YlbF family regulator n=1 Tax=Frisingicoccus sp. TaxID=1918627 RepID=UPI00373554C7